MNRSWAGRWLVLLGLIGNCGSGRAQVNSWNSDTGGNWDLASSWSLGVPPGASQSVFLTNAYWKALVIDSSTVSSAPQSLAIHSLTLTSVSPSNGVFTTRNTLLLNYAQPGNPLVIGVDTNTPGSLLVDSNSTMAMYDSGLVVNDALGASNAPLGNFQIDGNFIQSDDSEVVGGFLDLNGTYNMTNGQLFVGTQFISGAFNQQGGTNTGRVVAGTNGTYELFDGAFNGDITLDTGTFAQWGGTVSGRFTFDEPAEGGVYLLMGGLLLPGDVNFGGMPISNYNVFPGGIIEQGGGTNNPTSLVLAFGSYYLTNGVLATPAFTLTTNTWVGNFVAGHVEQYGGYVTNGELTMIGGTASGFKGQEIISPAKYHLYAGTLETPSLHMSFGNMVVAGLGAGASNILGKLSMDAASIYDMGNGAYVSADQFVITNGSQFWHKGGTLAGARNVTLGNGEWAESTAATQLGQLHLMSGTNSSVYLASGPCVLQFASSSIVPWPSGAILNIGNWSGSFTGGGAQRILFGSSASGLTAQQLSQVRFLNPSGLPNGTYGAKILSTGELVPDPGSSSAGPVNSWINSGSGNWDDASSWSLGVLPNSLQSVVIANPGSKAVAINPATPLNVPGSMTVSNLFVEGATNTENTLLLNNFGTVIPLTVLNGLSLQNGGQIVNLNSGLVVQNGDFMITNSDLIQSGGLIRATNGQIYVSGSEMDITNGVFEAEAVSLGYPVSSRYNQYGGTVTIQSLMTDSYILGTNENSVSLYGGMLNLPNGMSLYGEQGGIAYFQSGGTNITGQIFLAVDYGGNIPGFTLNGGLLADNGLQAMAGNYGDITINQNGGVHILTNTLSLIGESSHGLTAIPAVYNLNGGTLSAGGVSLNASMGTAAFNETNGIAHIGEFLGTSEPYESYWGAALNLSGGTLVCSNLLMSDSGIITQTGGALTVSNTLTVAGFIQPGPKIYSKYYFTNGTLFASNIVMGGNWFIGDSAGTNRIANPGTCTLSNSLSIGNANEQLGRFVLGGTATIDLAGGSSRLSFANSSGQTWAGGALLVIANWNGNPSGGGAEQLKFGSDPSGLTSAQLSQIQFQIGTNSYAAKILATGEVVPGQAAQPSVAYWQQGNNLVLSWPSGWNLQSATNMAGPFLNMTNATSPYTNDMTRDPQRYFRISSP